jgi:flavin-dependent dehydrogenase
VNQPVARIPAASPTGFEAASPPTWDALVVGAGPAGIIAALLLARGGYRVLLAEKKEFPRPKVCGGCLNARALSLLRHLKLDDVVAKAGAVPLDRLQILNGPGRVEIPLPPGLAVSRERLDAALLEAAVAAGVRFVSPATAHIGQLAASGASRIVTLQHAEGRQIVDARVVIAADGLQHSSLHGQPQFLSRIRERSPVGLGATFAIHADVQLPPHTVRMCVGSPGYVGMVRVENGLLNVAAALRPAILRQHASPGEAIQAILREAKAPLLPEATSYPWQGTPALTRATRCLAQERLFLVGDAAGYVEPFTGEGIAWALESAWQVSPLVDACLRGDQPAATLATQWERIHKVQVRRRQATCRGMAWILRSPRRVAWGVQLASVFPAFARRIASCMSQPFAPTRSAMQEATTQTTPPFAVGNLP